WTSLMRREKGINMKSLAIAMFVGLVSLFTSGCGVYMAFTQPPRVDTEALDAGGMSRDVVIERLGAPKSSVKNVDGSREDTFEYYEGSSSGWKIGRGIFHLAADFFTAALWEIVATPTEYGLRGDKITAQANFDNTDRLTSFRVLGGDIKPLEKKLTARPNASREASQSSMTP
ncbi:MAG TPA: hypothetical protein VN638_00905, partial [Nitrospiraceae bacterium]|nr:hypothetical protein [Nitrospiraceae bacterium]